MKNRALSGNNKKKDSNIPVLHHATLKESVQKRATDLDHSSIIPGINVNELKHSLDVLKYALDYSEAIVDTVRLPLIVLNKNLNVLTANRSFYDTFHLTPEETENQLIYNLSDKAWNIPKFKLLLEKILPANTHLDNYEVEIDIPHLGRRTFVLNARRTYRQVNNTEAMLLAFEDITDRKQLEKQKDDFIGIVSHELKTPLTGIKGYSQILERHLIEMKDEKGKHFLTKMQSQMERLTQLMASFLNVYNIQTGKLLLHKEIFALEGMVKSVISEFQITTKSHNIEFKSQSKVSVRADKERIMQVMVNLISNAIKYSPDAKKIVVKSEHDTKKVTLSVQDFGMGIPTTEQRKIFHRFYRVKGNKENNISGLGLGLYISHEIIDQHKGKMWIESKEGKGSTFHFSLPMK